MELLNVVFLDRDGVINYDYGYIGQTERVTIIPGVIDAINKINELGYKIVVITNQSGVARGFFSIEDVTKVNNHINKLIGKDKNNNSLIYKYYVCPHHPEGIIKEYRKECNCRKPNPGLINIAIEEFKKDGYIVNKKKSYFVGDKETDMISAKRALIKNKIFISNISINNKYKQYESLYDFSESLGS